MVLWARQPSRSARSCCAEPNICRISLARNLPRHLAAIAVIVFIVVAISTAEGRGFLRRSAAEGRPCSSGFKCCCARDHRATSRLAPTKEPR